MSEGFSDGFVKNKELLEENSRVEDLLDLSVELEKFQTKIDSIPFSSLVGFIGRFGTGKTNFLNQYRKKIEDENNKWFEFDAWKYPERKNLWEAFVLEIVKQAFSENDFKKVNKKISGKSTKGVWLDIITSITSEISDKFDFNFLDKFSEIFKKEPITKVYEFQRMLGELFEKIEGKNIYIVVEDIDRSGDNGVFFLETLNHFIKELKIEKRIIVIVPIGKENYDDELKKVSYSKCLDYKHDFSLREIRLDKFVKEIFDDEILKNKNWEGQIVSFLEGIFRKFPEQITMRLLKQILRDANLNYIFLYKKQGEGIDWRLSILFETAKHIKKHLDGGRIMTYISLWKNDRNILDNENIFSALIACIIQEEHNSNRNQFSSIYKADNYGKDMINIKGSTSFTILPRIINFDYSSAYGDKNSIIYKKKDNPFDKDVYFGIIEDYLW